MDLAFGLYADAAEEECKPSDGHQRSGDYLKIIRLSHTDTINFFTRKGYDYFVFHFRL